MTCVYSFKSAIFIQGLEAYNTRVFKTVGDGEKMKYELRFASSAVTGNG